MITLTQLPHACSCLMITSFQSLILSFISCPCVDFLVCACVCVRASSLGKTIMAISLLAYLAVEKHVWGQHLIVVPTSVIVNWEMEFKRWCPGFKILCYHGSARERKNKRVGWSDPNAFHVCITSYQLVLQDSRIFKRKKWHYLILDEAHNIKNFKSQRWQTLLNFRTHRRLLLTGTPLQVHLNTRTRCLQLLSLLCCS